MGTALQFLRPVCTESTVYSRYGTLTFRKAVDDLVTKVIHISLEVNRWATEPRHDVELNTVKETLKISHHTSDITREVIYDVNPRHLSMNDIIRNVEMNWRQKEKEEAQMQYTVSDMSAVTVLNHALLDVLLWN